MVNENRRPIKYIGQFFRDAQAKVLEREINCGERCKSCKAPIPDKSKWGKPALCQGCEDAIKHGISWH